MSMPLLQDFMALVSTTKKNAEKPNRRDRYYEKVYHKLENNKISWNWSAAIFRSLWFLYRKMYLYFFISSFLFFLSTIAIGLIFLSFNFFDSELFLENLSLNVSDLPILLTTLVWSFATAIPFGLIMGFFGNKLYLRHIKKKIEKSYHLASPKIKNTECGNLITASFGLGIIERIFKKNFPAYLDENLLLPTLLFFILMAFITGIKYWEDKKKVRKAILLTQAEKPLLI